MNFQQIMDVIGLKARAYANHKLERRVQFRGMNISIETDKGSTRSGVDQSGRPWSVKMTWPYGYITRSEGVDGDHVDCFLGPNENATHVYVIDTNNPKTNKFDEQKCMLGFDSADAAKKAFQDNYSNKDFFRGITAVPIDKFIEKVKATFNHPGKITAARLSKLESAAVLNCQVIKQNPGG